VIGEPGLPSSPAPVSRQEVIMESLSIFDISLPNLNEYCFICMGFVIIFLAGFLVLGGAVELWGKMRRK
jgi:hypothetical protein